MRRKEGYTARKMMNVKVDTRMRAAQEGMDELRKACRYKKGVNSNMQMVEMYGITVPM